MSDRNDETRPSDDNRTIEDEGVDQASTLQRAFDLSPETANATVRDNLASGTRKPASNDVDAARVAQAQEQNANEE